jgi:DNA polymerase-1
MFRKCYIARPGYKFYTADYSQLELRLIAEIGREIEMISAFKLGQDLHKKTATILYDKLIEEINRSERSRGKSLNFAINYGSTEYGLYVNFGIPIEEGREHLKKFFSGYKYLKSFIKLAGDQVIKLGYSITPLGRKRFFKDRSLFKDAYERERYIATTKREGVNHIIQGCAADVVKLAMLNIFRNNPFGEDLKILLQVHDELVIEFKDGLDKEVKEFVDREMIFALQKFLNDVPAMVDGKIDTCWSKE